MTDSSTKEGDDRDTFLVYGDSGGSPPTVRTRAVVFSKHIFQKVRQFVLQKL